jgi:hypothetical protein
MISFEIKSKKHGTKQVIIDDNDYELIKQHTWCLEKAEGDVFYAITNIRKKIGTKSMLRMHKLLHPEYKIIDHINGNGLDNRRCNLRECTTAQNSYNAKKSRNKSSKYKGVSWSKRNLLWKGYVTVNCKTKWLGYFKTEKEAALAYNTHAKLYFGEFAKINIIEDSDDPRS